MKLDEIPDLKSAKLTARIAIPVSQEIKDSLVRLKQVHKKDPLSWIRSIIEKELEKIEKGG